MQLRMEVDLEKLGDDQASELGRILRYWAGAVTQLDLSSELRHDLMNSKYEPVGTFTLGN